MTTESTLERILVEPTGFGLDSASPLQRAICRTLDGVPLGDLATIPEVVEAFGGPEAVASLPTAQPAELVLLAGIRCGKSLLAAACSVRAALTCDVSRLGPGEVPRVSILSLSLDTARATWAHVRGRIEASPTLRRMLVEEPTADALLLRHPTGRPIEIRVVAGSRAAGSLVARWSAGFIADEAPRMVGSDDGVVNLDDARHAVAGRLLPGAQMLLLGSPWAPFGPVYELVQEHAGKPTRELIVIRATAPAMNPSHWTPERVAELRKRDPDAARVDIDTEFMAPETALFTESDLLAVTRQAPLVREPESNLEYSGSIDPATKGNAWSFVLGANDGKRIVIAFARQWKGSKTQPLRPRIVLEEIAAICKRYRVDLVQSDQWAADALRDIASELGLVLREVVTTAQSKVAMFDDLRLRVVSGEIELPPDPEVTADLRAVRRRITQQGVSIELPRTSDGRHCDYAPAIAALAASKLAPPEIDPKRPEPGTREFFEARETERWDRQLAAYNEAEAEQRADESADSNSWIWGPND